MNMKTTDEMSTGKKKKERYEDEKEFDIEDEEEPEDVKPEDYRIILAPRHFERNINIGVENPDNSKPIFVKRGKHK